MLLLLLPLLLLLLLLRLLLQSPSVDDADFAGRMSNSLMTWVHCWSSDTDLDQLNKGELSTTSHCYCDLGYNMMLCHVCRSKKCLRGDVGALLEQCV
jgi:hypothetical protein